MIKWRGKLAVLAVLFALLIGVGPALADDWKSSPGIACFARAPSAVDAVERFDTLLRTAAEGTSIACPIVRDLTGSGNNIVQSRISILTQFVDLYEVPSNPCSVVTRPTRPQARGDGRRPANAPTRAFFKLKRNRGMVDVFLDGAVRQRWLIEIDLIADQNFLDVARFGGASIECDLLPAGEMIVAYAWREDG